MILLSNLPKVTLQVNIRILLIIKILLYITSTIILDYIIAGSWSDKSSEPTQPIEP